MWKQGSEPKDSIRKLRASMDSDLNCDFSFIYDFEVGEYFENIKSYIIIM